MKKVTLLSEAKLTRPENVTCLHSWNRIFCLGFVFFESFLGVIKLFIEIEKLFRETMKTACYVIEINSDALREMIA